MLAQKASCHDKAIDLSNAINDAHKAYREEAATISEKYKQSGHKSA